MCDPSGNETFWNGLYSKTKSLFGTEPNTFLFQKSTFLTEYFSKKNPKILVVGDGEGRNGIYLAKLGLGEVQAFDISPVGVEHAVAEGMKS